MSDGVNGYGSNGSASSGYNTTDLPSAWNRDRIQVGMDQLKEADDDTATVATASRKSFRLGPPPDQASFSRAGVPVYPASIRSSSPDDSQTKPLPPRPSLKSGDDTASGATQPIVDEIASALREWHSLMFRYLARRDYKLFLTVREHIESLHLGRRQLLAQTLSAEETTNLRRDCVTRLVCGNLVQGLDVIVRHPTWGGLVTVDVEGDIDNRSWLSAVRMYSMQLALAYLNVANDDTPVRPYPLPSYPDPNSSGPLPTPAHSAFPELQHRKSRSRSAGGIRPQSTEKSSAVKFYHIFLDLRAFVASPCSPGETAELFFSLYRKQDSKWQFITEDFCVILNHNGVLARNPSQRIRTLFVDLATSDLQESVYLVCRIVRNGALKISSSMSSGVNPDKERKPSEASIRFEPGSSTGYADSFGPVSPVSPRTAASYDPSGQFRRPFGCAVVELTQLSKVVAEGLDVSPSKEHSMPIYVPTHEAAFSMLHQNIIENNTKEYEKSPRAEMLAVSVKVFHGDASTIVKENTSLLQDVPHTLRLGFPDAVFPGDVRNELYIKLWSGSFISVPANSSRLSVNFSRAPMAPTSLNMQVTLEVRDSEGRLVENVISEGSGEPPMSQFHSMIFQRCNEPTFGELIKIQLPKEGMPQWHLFFTFRNRSTKERTGPYAFGFLPLFPDTRAFVEDGGHTLIMYRADKLSQITPEVYLNAASSLVGDQRPDQITVPPDLQRLAPPTKDTMTIRTSLCSTKLTQNPVLLSLLNWEKLPDHSVLSTILYNFTFVGEVEIVKFLRDIFDSLFGILISNINSSGEMDDLVFNALVFVLGIIQDRRFSNFRPVLDVYIEKHFSCAAASSHILRSMNGLLSNPASESANKLRSAFKVWHYVMKFVVRSRELQKAREAGMGGGATAEHFDANFKREVRSHIAEVTRMMSTSSPASIIGTQTIALQNFTSILPELAEIFSTVDLVSIVTNFAANAVATGKGKIVIWKLIMYLQIVNGFLFDNPQSRQLLVELVVSWIKPHFGKYDEYIHTQTNDSDTTRDAARVSWLESIRLCVTIVAVMLDKLQQQLVSPEVVQDRRRLRSEQENVENLLPLLPRLLDSYREFMSPETYQALERTRALSTVKAVIPVAFPESYPFSLLAYLPGAEKGLASSRSTLTPEHLFNPTLGEIAIVFLVLILSSPTKHITDFLESSLDIEGRDRLTMLLSNFFKIATSILDNDAFPKTWLNVNILSLKVLVKMLDPVSTLLVKEFIPPQENESRFDPQLWREAFYMLLKLLSSDKLVIEEFSPQKRRAVWRLAGDIRGEGATIMLNLWNALGWVERGPEGEEPLSRYGGYQVYLNSLVGHVVNLCLSHHEQLRNNAVQMLFSMIVSEYHQAGHFEDIENELVTRLDSLFMSDSKGDDISGAIFVGQLRHLFDSPSVDDQLRERVSEFLDSVDLFLELLLSVRALPEGEEFADERVIATLRLMNFIRRIGRDEIYVKYVHQLVNSQNYVEAGLTLKLHSDLYSWNLNSFVPPMDDLGLPQQSQFHRKETLCLLILDYLGKGKAWERAVDICKELAQQHSEVTFNYGRLSEILRHQATLLEHIVTDQRYYSDYYLVTFYGNFPTAIRDKRFIYRGYEWEKFGAFCERMLNKHPGAQLLRIVGDPPVDIRFGSDQYMQCCAVVPEPNRELPVFTNPDAPPAVRAYYEHSAINLFSSSRQIQRVARDRTEETWTEKIYYTTEDTFPTVLRRSQVVGVQVVEISPVENALYEVEQKMKELAALELKYQSLAKTSQDVSTNALAMALNSVVDAPLNTGIAAYRQQFFAPEYTDRNPDRTEMVEKLRSAVDDQVRIIDHCLKLHGQLCPPEFVPFHETLEKFFRKNFREEIRRLGLDESSETMTISPSEAAGTTAPSQYQPSVYAASVAGTTSGSSVRRAPFTLPPLQFGRSMTPPPLSPQSHEDMPAAPGRTQQTPLQRHLAHLARHGINGVSSAPGENFGSDSVSAGSPHDSFVNVGNGIHGGSSGVQASNASVVTSNPGGSGSLVSLGSIRGRISRFGSLNFGRRG
ncbi:cytoplasmic protein [Moniliophthora roreri]|nr:cytoplasmic protein [Moniliophthora roreri]